ncbi:hypothetical protein HPB52_004571 [Rhipicephalus sanguineus]|uniref:DDE Tnp4 domain-containing protein n=1 Tax=Rhipicephalus sanguineus TaxID=34632 RepID=A0A9D4SN06_RHISA|nr:hypothetical protein HPB52_004571 [Rhipicephalus sanguineus]
MVLTKRRKRLLLLKKKILLVRKMLEDKRQRRWWVRPSWRTRHAESEFFTTTPTTATWLQVAEGYCQTWQFPNCVGAVDGKHVQIKCPPNSGSMYFHYKGTYSIVLLAVVDSDYKFVVVDVGAYGKQSDGGVLEQSKRCAENAFGILAARWRILARTMGEKPEHAEVLVKALCALHNFLMHRCTEDDDAYCGPGFADSVDRFGQRRSGQWRNLLAQPPMPVAHTQACHFAQAAWQVRDLYARYFSSAVGKVPWQDKIWCPVNPGPDAALPAAQ